MRRSSAMLLAVPIFAALVLAVACTGGNGGGAPASTSGATGPSATSTASLPGPDSALPTDPAQLATRLETTTARLRSAIDDWLASGDTGAWPPPDDVVFLALDQQRIYGTLSGSEPLRTATIADLPADLQPGATANATADAELASIGGPVRGPVQFKTEDPLPADVLLGFYREAQKRFGVSWQVLAAINLIETRFGRVVSTSSAGALGPMQFIRSTWRAYGLGGDVHDPHDAILGAANYLSAAGAPSDYRAALLAYNPVKAYVDAVLLYARQMRSDIRNYYAYYNWQVFVVTRSGERRLTGP